MSSNPPRVKQDREVWYDIRTGKQVDDPTASLYATMGSVQEALAGVKEELRSAMADLHEAFDGMKRDIATLQSSYTDLLKKHEELCAEKDRE